MVLVFLVVLRLFLILVDGVVLVGLMVVCS